MSQTKALCFDISFKTLKSVDFRCTDNQSNKSWNQNLFHFLTQPPDRAGLPPSWKCTQQCGWRQTFLIQITEFRRFFRKDSTCVWNEQVNEQDKLKKLSKYLLSSALVWRSLDSIEGKGQLRWRCQDAHVQRPVSNEEDRLNQKRTELGPIYDIYSQKSAANKDRPAISV